jgi:hypothetical protein
MRVTPATPATSTPMTTERLARPILTAAAEMEAMGAGEIWIALTSLPNKRLRPNYRAIRAIQMGSTLITTT